MLVFLEILGCGSPTGGVGLYRRDGDLMLAEAAAEANIPYIMSGGSNASMEEAVRVAPNNTWFQLYAAKDRDLTDALIGRARDAGVGALVLTVDVPVHPKRERNWRNGFATVRNGGVMEALKLKPSILLEAMTHPGWVMEYIRHGGAPTLGQLGAACRQWRHAPPTSIRLGRDPDAGLGADLA